MTVDRDRFPRWVWLMLGLFVMAMLANMVNAFVLIPNDIIDQRYAVVTVIAGMAPVIVYVGIWYDDHRRHYWEYHRLKIAGDLTFIVLGTIAGTGFSLIGLAETGLHTIVQDLIGMTIGFLAGWLLFYVRNPDLYFTGEEPAR